MAFLLNIMEALGELSVNEFDSDNIMLISGYGYTLMQIITLRNFLTYEIDRVQRPVVDMLKGVKGNGSH